MCRSGPYFTYIGHAQSQQVGPVQDLQSDRLPNFSNLPKPAQMPQNPACTSSRKPNAVLFSTISWSSGWVSRA